MAGTRKGDQSYVALNAGELSPELAGRADVEKTAKACRTLQNMTVGVYGAVERRPGFQFIAVAGVSEVEE